MIKTAIRFAVLALLSTTALWAQSDAQKSFEKLKTLVGTWEGQTSDGQPVCITYRITSGGSALMSEINSEDSMVTMFHLDGDRLLMTHYCGAGNQPRMKASLSSDGKTVVFNFLDATNLASPDTGHMYRAAFTMTDASHHVEEWTFLDHGKEHTERFELHRVATADAVNTSVTPMEHSH